MSIERKALNRVMSAFVKGDPKKFTVLRQRVIHGKTLREISAETGMGLRQVCRLVDEFDAWLDKWERGECSDADGSAAAPEAGEEPEDGGGSVDEGGVMVAGAADGVVDGDGDGRGAR